MFRVLSFAYKDGNVVIALESPKSNGSNPGNIPQSDNGQANGVPCLQQCQP